MAGWSKIVGGCGLESFKAVQKVHKIETWIDPEPFSKRLTTIEENGRNMCFDGQEIDLCKLVCERDKVITLRSKKVKKIVSIQWTWNQILKYEEKKTTRKLFNGDENWGLVELDGDVKNAYEKKYFQIFDEEISEVEDGNGDDVEMNSDVVDRDPNSRKRNMGCYLGMLKWINNVATDPCDPVIGSLPERHKWKYYGCEELWKQVLLVREAMLLEGMVDSSGQQTSLQKQQNMHPNMYYGQRGSERLRCSERLLSAKDSFKKARIGSESLSSDSRSGEYPADKQSDSMAYSVALWGNYQCRKRIPLGSLFQANIPEFTGKTNESGSTWLGTRIWPLEKCENKGVLIERDRIGNGRQDSCGCQFPGSVECVKFHVAQKSSRLKLELCSAFDGWKFNSMGEKVALCWTKEEQNRFQDIVKLNPSSQDKYFWDELLKLLPRKGKEALVSYYFNVFLLRRRGYQNRMSPSNIDSDDEESEFGQLAAKSPGSIFCSPRKSHQEVSIKKCEFRRCTK